MNSLFFWFSAKPLTVTLNYKVAHKTSKAEDSGIVHGTVPIEISGGAPDTIDGKARSNLLKMLEGKPAQPVLFQYIFPKFLKVTNRGTATPVADLMVEIPGKNNFFIYYEIRIIKSVGG